MSIVMGAFKVIYNNFQPILTGLIAIISGVIAIAMIIPGAQPEKALQGLVDFLTKLSKK
jgi:hypothetical protein